MSPKEKLKRIYVIRSCITVKATNTINDTLLLATDDFATSDEIVERMKQELKKSIVDFAALLVSLHCNIPDVLQQPEIRNSIKCRDIEFHVSSILLSDIRRI